MRQLGVKVRVLRGGIRIAAALVVGVAAPAAAQDSVTIDGGTTAGVTTVNSASGNNNQQLNLGLLSQSDLALSAASARQHLGGSSGDSGDSAVTLEAGAFAGSSGWIAVNGASGNDNQQANMAAFAIGIEAGAAADTLLSQSRASTQPAGKPSAAVDSPVRSVAVGEGAFEGSSGLVQVSLIGGDRNSSANTFALSISGEATP